VDLSFGFEELLEAAIDVPDATTFKFFRYKMFMIIGITGGFIEIWSTLVPV